MVLLPGHSLELSWLYGVCPEQAFEAVFALAVKGDLCVYMVGGLCLLLCGPAAAHTLALLCLFALLYYTLSCSLNLVLPINCTRMCGLECWLPG